MPKGTTLERGMLGVDGRGKSQPIIKNHRNHSSQAPGGATTTSSYACREPTIPECANTSNADS